MPAVAAETEEGLSVIGSSAVILAFLLADGRFEVHCECLKVGLARLLLCSIVKNDAEGNRGQFSDSSSPSPISSFFFSSSPTSEEYLGGATVGF